MIHPGVKRKSKSILEVMIMTDQDAVLRLAPEDGNTEAARERRICMHSICQKRNFGKLHYNDPLRMFAFFYRRPKLWPPY